MNWYTITQVAKMLGETEWKVRRAVDCLPERVPRVGPGYRMIPGELLEAVQERIVRRNQKKGHIVTDIS
jgi:hypothetical protein